MYSLFIANVHKLEVVFFHYEDTGGLLSSVNVRYCKDTEQAFKFK